MSHDPEFIRTRREFLATTTGGLASAGLAAGSLLPAAAQQPGVETLAVDGGPKAVASLPVKPPRWGDPELRQLESMVEQDTLFYWKGPQTTQFIEGFRKFCPLEHVMTCSSGTAALHIAVAAAGVSMGDEVITSPITDMGTVIGVLYQQAVPVFADLQPHTYNLDPADVERRITDKTKAIIAVHLCGNPCDMQALRELADSRGLVLIEDCCQGWGARYRGQPLGTHGHLACFSLQNSKHITCGDGGVVASSDPRMGPLLQPLGDKGYSRTGGDGLCHYLATNYRMSEPQAAVAAGQLTRLESIASRRARLGNRLTERIQSAPGIDPHHVRDQDRCVYWFYMLRLRPETFPDRARFVKALVAEGVPASAGYIRVPLYGNPIFQDHSFFGGRWPVRELGLTAMDYTQTHCPEVDAILATGVRITIDESMTDETIDQIGAAVNKVAQHYAA